MNLPTRELPPHMGQLADLVAAMPHGTFRAAECRVVRHRSSARQRLARRASPTIRPPIPRHSPRDAASLRALAAVCPRRGCSRRRDESARASRILGRHLRVRREFGRRIARPRVVHRPVGAATQPHVARHVGESPTSAPPFDVPAIREDFPILRQKVHGKPLAWLDNAATTQKPQSVIDAISHFYEHDNSNIHRGAHTLAARATDAYEKAREKVQTFLGASSIEGDRLRPRHDRRHQPRRANLRPQVPAARRRNRALHARASCQHRSLADGRQGKGGRSSRDSRSTIAAKSCWRSTKSCSARAPRSSALTHASNSLGTILPVAEMTQMAKRYGARVLIDGAQSVAHMPVNVQQLGADFFVFSGHKIFGPTGIGAVYIKEELHDILPPWQGGGNMIRNVTFEETILRRCARPVRSRHAQHRRRRRPRRGARLCEPPRACRTSPPTSTSCCEYATEGLTNINGLRLIGTAREKVGVLSFVLPNRRTEDVGRLLDQEGIAVRAGHHCSQPSLRRFGVESTVRPSLSLYNTNGEIDRLVDAVQRIQRMP